MSSKAIITHVNASSVTTSAFAQALTTHTNLQATDILLLSAILDKYFIDSYGLSDSAAIAFARAIAGASDNDVEFANALIKLITFVNVSAID